MDIGMKDVEISLEKIKEYNQELQDIEEYYKKQIENLKDEYENKVQEINEQKEPLIEKVKEYAMNSSDLEQSKTQYSLKLNNNKIVIKKPKHKLNKPKINDENADKIKKEFPDFIKEKIDIDWKELQNIIMIKDGKAYNIMTGEDITDIVPVEYVEEKIEIK